MKKAMIGVSNPNEIRKAMNGRTFDYNVGVNYVDIYGNDNSGNPFATVENEADAILIINALNSFAPYQGGK